MNIEGINLSDEHKGREVTYLSKTVSSIEMGIISSWNDNYVFVKYESNTCATNPKDLYWGNRETEFKCKQAIINSTQFNDLINVTDIEKFKCFGKYYNIAIKGIEVFSIDSYFDNNIFVIHRKEEPKLKIIKREIKIKKILK